MSTERVGQGAEEARIAALYQLGAVEQPPCHLDAAITAAARSPSETVIRRRRASAWSGWRPFAFAAVAVVSASVAIIAHEERGDPLRIDAPAPAPTPDTRARPSEAPSADVASGVQAKPAARGFEPRSAVDASSSSSAETSNGPRVNVLADRELERKKAVRDGSPTSASPPEPAVTRPEASPARAREATDASRGIAQSAAASSFESNAAPPLEARRAAAGAGRFAADEQRAPTPASRAAAPAAAQGASSERAERSLTASIGSLPALIAGLEGQPPARWLDRIRSLRTEGRRDEADAVLAEFRRRYPDEFVPSSLQ